MPLHGKQRVQFKQMWVLSKQKPLFLDILVILSILRYFSNSEHENIFLAGELKMSLWSLGGHAMTLTRQMSSFSGPARILSLALWS